MMNILLVLSQRIAMPRCLPTFTYAGTYLPDLLKVSVLPIEKQERRRSRSTYDDFANCLCWGFGGGGCGKGQPKQGDAPKAASLKQTDKT